MLRNQNLCGLCGDPKEERNYNVAKHGVNMQTVALCVRCDLTPEPPLRPHDGRT